MSIYDPTPLIIKTERADFIVPERLREIRGLRGMTLKSSAELLGISPRQLGLYENGRAEVPKEMLFNLQKLYNVKKSYFYEIRWKRV